MFFMVATSFTSNSVVHAIAVSPRPITQRSRAVAKTSSPDPRVADQGKILVNIQATLTRIEATQAAQGATQAAQGVTLTSTRNWVVSAVVSLPFAPVCASILINAITVGKHIITTEELCHVATETTAVVVAIFAAMQFTLPYLQQGQKTP
jgi:hypothetical protein